jgi:hypothetical protein
MRNPPCFAIFIDRTDMTLYVEVLDEWLRKFLTMPSIKLLDAETTHAELAVLLSGYRRLKRGFCRFKHWVLSRPQKSKKLEYDLRVTRLFAEDFMRDRDIFSTFGLEHFYEVGQLERSLLKDVRRHTIQIQRDLDQIDEAVGIDPEAEANNTEPTGNHDLLHPSIRRQLRRVIQKGDLLRVKECLRGQKGRVDGHTLGSSLLDDQLKIFWTLLGHGALVNDGCWD